MSVDDRKLDKLLDVCSRALATAQRAEQWCEHNTERIRRLEQAVGLYDDEEQLRRIREEQGP